MGKTGNSPIIKRSLLSFLDDRGYSERNLRNMKRFAEAYPTFPIWQVPLAKLKELPILQESLAELENEGKEVVQIPLAQVGKHENRR